MNVSFSLQVESGTKRVWFVGIAAKMPDDYYEYMLVELSPGEEWFRKASIDRSGQEGLWLYATDGNVFFSAEGHPVGDGSQIIYDKIESWRACTTYEGRGMFSGALRYYEFDPVLYDYYIIVSLDDAKVRESLAKHHDKQ